LDDIGNAYDRVANGEVRFRALIKMENTWRWLFMFGSIHRTWYIFDFFCNPPFIMYIQIL
jgi:hypothetical protein